VKSRFADSELEALESDGVMVSEAVTKAFRKRMQVIHGARDERDFYALKSLHYEKLKGQRDHQHSMRLNDQYRLILEYEGTGPNKTVVIVSIEDYH
jgi:proteic killer suppression protein